MTDPAEIRAEGRRLLAKVRVRDRGGEMVAYERPAEVDAAAAFLYRNADVLLADPAPVGLTAGVADLLREQNRELHRRLLEAEERRDFWHAAYEECRTIQRRRGLSAAPVDDRERVPEGWRVAWQGCCPDEECVRNDVPRLVPVSPSVDPEEGP